MYKLMIFVCSPIIGSCYPEAIISGSYDNYYDCTIQGYSESIVFLNELGKEMVEKNQLFTKFICQTYELI
tara:strand:- start:245 stop:454 length:210 start_codon:yes stop_codon:yes gene_type:complete